MTIETLDQRWEDMTWPTKTKAMTKTKTNTFWEHLLRAILETCDIWDTEYNSDNWEPELMTIFVTWQLIVTLDSIRNSCDVWCQSYMLTFGRSVEAMNSEPILVIVTMVLSVCEADKKEMITSIFLSTSVLFMHTEPMRSKPSTHRSLQDHPFPTRRLNHPRTAG